MNEGFRRLRYFSAKVTSGGLQLIEWMEPEDQRHEGVEKGSFGNPGVQSTNELVGTKPIGNVHSAHGELIQRARMIERAGLFVACHGFFALAQRPKRFASVAERLRIVWDGRKDCVV